MRYNPIDNCYYFIYNPQQSINASQDNIRYFLIVVLQILIYNTIFTILNLDNIIVDDKFFSIFLIISIVCQKYDEIMTYMATKLFYLQLIDYMPKLIPLNYDGIFQLIIKKKLSSNFTVENCYISVSQKFCTCTLQ